MEKKMSEIEETLREFASLFDPPMKVGKENRISLLRPCMYLYMCSQDDKRMCFTTYDDEYFECCIGINDSLDSWMTTFGQGGRWMSSEKLFDDTKIAMFKTITHYNMPSFNSIEELKLKLIAIGYQEPIVKIDTLKL